MTPINRLYTHHPVLMGALLGGLLGYLVLSPVSMLLEHLTHTSIDDLWPHISEAFLLGNPAWTGFFTLLGLSVGAMYGYITKRIEDLQGHLLRAEKLATVGQLAAGVAHEINTPLSNISIKVETMRMRNSDPNIQGGLDDIANQVDAAASIVKGLLEYSSQSGLEKVDVDINELLQGTAAFVRGLRGEDVAVVENLRRDLPMVLAEPNQLKQAFTNIINNAFDAMPGGGQLRISTDLTEKGCVRIVFEDTGNGIPPEEVRKVFDPFYTTKDPGKGTGLGLSICQSIIRKHNGRIEVESTVGEGTTVKVLMRR